jgi:hypothetical protein
MNTASVRAQRDFGSPESGISNVKYRVIDFKYTFLEPFITPSADPSASLFRY